MTIERINLLPPTRCAAHRQRSRAMRWAAVCTAYGLAAVVIAPALSEAGAGSRALETQERRLQRDIERATESTTELAREHQELMRSSRLVHELRGSADWGRLLGAVAATIASDAALEGLTLAPRKEAPGYTLTLTGVAVSQRAVTQMALQLEQLAAGDEPLFASVTIRESRRRMIGSTQAVTFSIDCALREPTAESSRESEP